MKSIVLFLAIFFATPAFSDIYYWFDEKGTLHIVDDITKVPEERRRSVDKVTTVPLEEKPPAEEAPVAPAPVTGEELYGDYPLTWWHSRITAKKKEISTVESEYGEKKRFVEVFELGRRFGQVYSVEHVDVYKEFKKEIPGLEKKLETLRGELEEILLRARKAGVPKEIRGE